MAFAVAQEVYRGCSPSLSFQDKLVSTFRASYYPALTAELVDVKGEEQSTQESLYNACFDFDLALAFGTNAARGNCQVSIQYLVHEFFDHSE